MNQAMQVDWIPGLIILGIGAVLGLALLWWTRRKEGRKSEEAPDGETAERLEARALPDELRDLRAERDHLIRRLQELEDLASSRTEAQLARERYELELRAAEILRRIEEEEADVRGVAEGEPVPEPESSTGRGALAGFLWGAGTVAAVAALIFFVNTSSTDREAGAPVTGSVPQAQMEPDADHPDLERLQHRVEQNPEDLQARLDLAQLYLMSDRPMETFEQTRFVLQRDPENARALSYEAVVRFAMGQGAQALSMLDRAIASDPRQIDAWVHKTLVLASLGQLDEATALIEEARSRFPEQERTWAGLENHLRSQFAQSQGLEKDPTGAPAPLTAQTAAEAGEGVSGTLRLADSAYGRISLPAVVYVIGRAEGATQGPPIAVNRLVVESFPVEFSLGPEHAMMGGSLTDRIRIEVRIDTDGDVSTTDPGVPTGSADGVELGKEGLEIELL